MERNHDDECRYCDQDRHAGWIYCRSCGRLLSRAEVINVRAERSPATAAARRSGRG
ncbi:MAG TPA: hypothetical protein VLA82_03655 [Actinomycetota bacterium]|nr:hypothetical protein [Actinomycetota bacterium]